MEFAARAEHSVMKDPGLLQVLLAFALVPDMAEVTPPPIDRFELTNGHLLNAGVARDDIEGFYRSFGRHSESDLPRQRYETDEDYEHMSGSRLMSISRIMKKPSLVLSLRIRQRVGIQRYALEDGPRTGLRNVMESIGRKDPRSNGRSVRNFSMIEMKKKRRIGNSSASKEWQLNTSLTFFNTDLTWVISSTRDTGGRSQAMPSGCHGL